MPDNISGIYILDKNILQIIFNIIIILLLGYLAFFKSYLQEKGKNLAKKEDIEKITSIIEEIKSQLYFTTHSKLTLIAEERAAIVDYFAKYHCWLETIIEVDPLGAADETKKEEITSQLSRAKFDFQIARAKKEIFVENDELNKIEQSILPKTLALQQLVEKTISDLEQINFQINETKSSTTLREDGEEHKEQLAKKKKILSNFWEKQLDEFSKITDKNHEVRDIIYNHLEKIISSHDVA